MIKKLTRHGNSLALIIDKPILDLLEIDADTPLEVKTDGESLVLTPSLEEEKADLKEAHKERVLRAIEEGNHLYGRALKNLAQ